jgi:hypothetical protein
MRIYDNWMQLQTNCELFTLFLLDYINFIGFSYNINKFFNGGLSSQ